MPHSTYSHACMHAYAHTHTHTHMHTHVNAHAQTHRPAYDCTCTFPQVFEPISDQRGAGKVGGMSRRCNHVSKASPGLVQILLQVCARFSCVSVYACTYERAYVCLCARVCMCIICVCVYVHHLDLLWRRVRNDICTAAPALFQLKQLPQPCCERSCPDLRLPDHETHPSAQGVGRKTAIIPCVMCNAKLSVQTTGRPLRAKILKSFAENTE